METKMEMNIEELKQMYRAFYCELGESNEYTQKAKRRYFDALRTDNQTRAAAEKWINDGNPCIYRSGWEYRGARHRNITNEEAKKMLPQYTFGKTFHRLTWSYINGGIALEFNELSALDME